MKANTLNAEKGNFALARARNVPISTKQSIEISNALRYKKTQEAKAFLESVVALERAVPFYHYTLDMGHKAGMSAGRFPQKAAREFLRLIKSVESNAQVKGLNSTHLKITKIIANKAPIPASGGRRRHHAKRTHLEIEVKEGKEKEKKASTVEPTLAKEKKRKESKSQKTVVSNIPKKDEGGT